MHIVVVRGGLGNIIYQLEYALSLKGRVIIDLSWYDRHKSHSWRDYLVLFRRPSFMIISNRYLIKILKVLGRKEKVSDIDSIYFLGRIRIHEGYWQQSDYLARHKELISYLKEEKLELVVRGYCGLHVRTGDFHESTSHEIVEIQMIERQLAKREIRLMPKTLVTNDSNSELVRNICDKYSIEDISSTSVEDWRHIFNSAKALGSKQSTFFKTAAILGESKIMFYED